MDPVPNPMLDPQKITNQKIRTMARLVDHTKKKGKGKGTGGNASPTPKGARKKGEQETTPSCPDLTKTAEKNGEENKNDRRRSPRREVPASIIAASNKRKKMFRLRN